jgi:hypothetical protein
MKWFRHESDSHSNIKLGAVVHQFGLKGYALYWLCLELVAQQGSMTYELNHNRTWELALCTFSGLEVNELRTILKRFGELELICAKSLEEGKLSIPKMADYADTYTVRRTSEERKKSVGSLYCNVLYGTLNDFDILWSKYPNKLGKKEAFKHFQASVRTEENLKNIGLALDNYLASEWCIKEGGKYIQCGKTWFNNWEDWIVPPKAAPDKYLKKETR